MDILFWQILEADTFFIPNYIKNGFSMCGFANPISFKTIDDDHIRNVEDFIKKKCLGILQNRLSESFGEECDALVPEQEMIDHFGIYADADTRSFEFHAGDIMLIKELVKYVNQIVHEKGLQYFRKRTETKMKMIETKQTKKAKKNIEIVERDLKSQLLQKVIALYTSANSLNNITFDIGEINDNFVKVLNDEKGQTFAEIVCIVCKNKYAEKSKPKKIGYNIDRNGNGCWVVSNFKKHLEQAHHLVIGKCQKGNAKLKKNVAVISDENSSHGSEHDTDSNNDKLEQNQINDGTNNGSSNDSVQITNDDDLCRIENADEDTELMIFDQLSNQITNVMESVLNHNESREPMNFVLGKSPRTIKVACIEPNGDCALGSMAHQLFMYELSSRNHKEATKQLRKDVVQHILDPKNFPMFLHSLKDRVYAINDENKITDDDCKFFVQNELSKKGTWCGREALLAVSNIYSTNVVVFYEDGLCYKIKAAGQNYDRSIAIAYRLDASQTERNHYDSVCDVNSKDLLVAAGKMAKKTQK